MLIKSDVAKRSNIFIPALAQSISGRFAQRKPVFAQHFYVSFRQMTVIGAHTELAYVDIMSFCAATNRHENVKEHYIYECTVVCIHQYLTVL